MHPVLGQLVLGDHVVSVGAYSTFQVLAWVTALGLGVFVAWKRGFSWWRVLVVFAVALAAGLLGARLLDVATAWNYYTERPDRIYLLEFTGFSLYGGLVAALAVAALLARRFGLSLWRLADSAVPALAAGLVLMRVGCLLEGCCFGTVTSLPWGVEYGPGSPAWALQLATGRTGILGMAGAVEPVHPTQVYEMIAALAFCALGISLLVRRAATGVRRYPDGVAFLIFALGFTLFRLGNGFLRATVPALAMPPWFYPALYLAICAVIVALLLMRLRTRPRPHPAGPDQPGDPSRG